MTPQPMLKGYRTYVSIALLVLIGISQNYLATHTVLTVDITSTLMALFGALAAYFRSQA